MEIVKWTNLKAYKQMMLLTTEILLFTGMCNAVHITKKSAIKLQKR